MRRRRFSPLAALIVLLAAIPLARGAGGDEAAPEVPRLAGADATEVLGQLTQWIDQLEVDDAMRSAALAPWESDPAVDPSELVIRVARTVAAVDARFVEMVTQCTSAQEISSPVSIAWLAHLDVIDDESLPRVARDHLRLLLGRWLAQQRLYEEALEVLAEIDPVAVVDPASLLFYQCVAHHCLLNKEEGLAALDSLLGEVADLPQRYTSLAGLMRADLNSLDEESLDHVARQMSDIHRRLDLGRAGPKTRDVEDEVIRSLNKMIEELEKQQQQQQQQASSGGGSNAPNNPAPDSRIMGGAGRGDVDIRDIGSKSGWGSLPPKQREEALQQIGKDFPAHYRDVIEQYFRRLAGDQPAREGE